MSASRSVAAVVPTFRPGSDVATNVESLVRQCRQVLVVDDGSGSEAYEVLQTARRLGAHVMQQPENRGIACALNVGVRSALRDAEIQYVLTVDQDTRLPDGFVSAEVNHYRAARSLGTVGIVVPGVVAGQPVKIARRMGGEHFPAEPIQSGMLIAREVFEKVGLFREEFFIDCVDTDYFLRAAASGYTTVAAMDCSIAHELGRRASTIPGRPGIAIYPPFRRYYMARNRLVLIHEHGRRNKAWLRYTLLTEGVGFLLVLLRGSHRRHQVLAALEGYRAFRSASLGPIPPDVAVRLGV